MGEGPGQHVGVSQGLTEGHMRVIQDLLELSPPARPPIFEPRKEII